MAENDEQTLQQGIAAHNTGNLQEAERLYRAILEVHPRHPDANHNLGLIAVAENQSGAALLLFKIAVEANPNIEQFWLSYIDALIAERQFEDAKRALKKGKKKGVGKDKLKILAEKLASVKMRNIPIPVPARAKLQKLIDHYQNGRNGDAEELALAITSQFPEHPFSYNVLGGVYERTGRLSESVLVSEKVAALSPKDAKAHSNLGLALKGLGKLAESELSYKRALKLKPDFVEAYRDLGNVLNQLGRLEEAQESYEQALALKNDDAETHYNLAIILNKLGRLEEAEACYRQAIALKPDFAEAHGNLGGTLNGLDRLEEAETSYKKAIALKSEYAEAHNNLGVTLQELGRLEEAEASYRQAIALKPEYSEAHNNLGVTLHELGELEEAEASYRQAIALKTDYAEAHSNLGKTLQELGVLEEAETSVRQSIALKSDFAEAHHNLGVTLQARGRLVEAEASFGQAVVLKPSYTEAKFHKSRLLLNRQEFRLGWSLYTASRDSKAEARESEVIPGSFIERTERWKGTSLRGKSIQVYAAQGVGDEIMFSSCIPDLIKKFPKSIQLECDPRLQPLFARSFPEVTVCGVARTGRSPQTYNGTDLLIEDVHFDYSIPIDGLPQFFRNKIEDFPSRDAFLLPDRENVDKWAKRLAGLGEGLKIGISWFGGAPKFRNKQSIPLADWGNLLSLDAFFVNLQYGNTSDEVARFSAENNIKIYDWEDNDSLLNLDNQAALISTLDLVITVDNATVHSCISLGKEVWNMLDPSSNLMWMENGTGISPLSHNLRFFKKKNHDGWGAVLSHVEEQLREKISVCAASDAINMQ